jgi:hypothetical protein
VSADPGLRRKAYQMEMKAARVACLRELDSVIVNLQRKPLPSGMGKC